VGGGGEPALKVSLLLGLAVGLVIAGLALVTVAANSRGT
jgi:hypothetical protein